MFCIHVIEPDLTASFSSECRPQLNTRLCMNLFACCLAYMYFIVKAVEEGEVIIKESLEQCDNPNHAAVTCTAGMLWTNIVNFYRSCWLNHIVMKRANWRNFGFV